MFASLDPVALDHGLCRRGELAQTPDARLRRGLPRAVHGALARDHFHADPSGHGMGAVCLEHAEKIGIGTRAYELIKI